MIKEVFFHFVLFFFLLLLRIFHFLFLNQHELCVLLLHADIYSYSFQSSSYYHYWLSHSLTFFFLFSKAFLLLIKSTKINWFHEKFSCVTQAPSLPKSSFSILLNPMWNLCISLSFLITNWFKNINYANLSNFHCHCALHLFCSR